MATAIAIAAGLLALVACVIGAKGWRTSQRLALEMVHLRERLARAEQGYREARHAASSGETTQPPADAAWAPRLAELEDRLRAALERGAARAEEGTEPDTRRNVRQYLQREGYTRVAILDENPDGTLELEAERGGVMTKGRAEILTDGTVRLQTISSVRAFP